MFQKMLAKLSGQVLILGSRLLSCDADNRDVDERVSTLFPYHVDIKPPEEDPSRFLEKPNGGRYKEISDAR